MIQYLKLGSLTRIRTGKLDANAADDNGTYPFFTCSREPLSINTCSYDCECVLVAGNGDLNVKYYDGKFDAYQRTYIIESLDKTKLMVKYLYYFLDLYVEILRQQAIGGVIKYIKLGNLADAIIPVPVIEKQREIIEIFEKCNGTIAYRQQELLLMDQLVKSRFIEMFGNLESNPKGWKQSTLGDECYYIKDGPHKSPKYLDSIDGIPFISTRNVVSGDGIDWSTAKYISEADYLDCIKKCHPEKGDILYSKGGTTGIAKLVDTDIRFANWVHVAVLKFGAQLDGRFLECMLNMNYCYAQSQALTKGIANKDFVLSAIAQVKIYVPPIELQRKYTEFVKRTDKSKFYIVQMQILLRLLIRAIQQKTTEVLL